MPVREKARFEITWPNVVRVAHVYRPRLSLDVDRLDPLELDARHTPQLVELAEVVDGVPDFARVSGIDLDALAQEFRTQRIVFETAGDIDAARLARREGRPAGSARPPRRTRDRVGPHPCRPLIAAVRQGPVRTAASS